MDPSNAVFGSKGDFITSPEISQVFGEVRALLHSIVADKEMEGNEPLAMLT